ncbi:hypothetical protein DFP72DRAFT_1070714 [Ephemerocybe angulata]|uniref:NACHT domain-containing protein n=1 Tax=Ephemerocybe angulata TaxID=980116 RepID=A0A8H6M1H9_9AGAR|nr:hypothetical protein DFP72DRAFT_1070714 [Tulosesus angulatus]
MPLIIEIGQPHHPIHRAAKVPEGGVIDKIVSWAVEPSFHATNDCFRRPIPPQNNPLSPSTTSIASTAMESAPNTAHIYYMCGTMGSGKSAIAQAVAEELDGQKKGHLGASYFFFSGTDRRKLDKFAMTLASQIKTTIPSTSTLIEAARSEDGLCCAHLGKQLHRLVLHPLQSVLPPTLRRRGTRNALLAPIRDWVLPPPRSAKYPVLFVIDGLDECEDRLGVKDFIEFLLQYFEEKPQSQIRVFITSRSEGHIQSLFEGAPNRVYVDRLDSSTSQDDIDTYLEIRFKEAARIDPVIRVHIEDHGAWPSKEDRTKLVGHIGCSFLFASMVADFILEQEKGASTPMNRLKLALKMEFTGVDDLYTQKLKAAQHVDHFMNAISTIALVDDPLTIPHIAQLLEIGSSDVLNVLRRLQAIIPIPENRHTTPVTFFHHSLREFLLNEKRAGIFFPGPAIRKYLATRRLELDQSLDQFARLMDGLSPEDKSRMAQEILKSDTLPRM